ncbi:MAG TPA: long-chain fatty acid--CoA ligase [Solirubrobacteraceae bacterium]|jgi:long-chain acyl-CoA synthetase|nr:long-chain fatty acid--CoA ligase [Solirubrobacteraceae bacterium]
MTESTRAIAATVAALPSSAAQRFGDHLAARHRVEGEWRELTYAEVVQAIGEVALGLAELGIEPGDRVGVLADTRLEWTVASYGISAAGAVVVPVYPTSSPRECAWVLGNSGAKAVVCENDGQVAKVAQVREDLPDLGVVIVIDGDGGDMSLEALRERGRGRDRAELEERQSRVAPEDAYTIIYTSGTTGPPKGVVLTHGNAMAVCEMVEELEFIEPDETSYLFLPLAHAFALTVQLASFDQGTAIVYYGGDTKQILAEVIETKPTYLPSVPRIFEKLYTAAQKMAEGGSDEDRARFAQAVKLGVEVRRRRDRGEEIPAEMEHAFEQAEERLYSRVRGLFGGNIHRAVTGAAPIASDILEFFYACGVPVLEGWGMTETTGVGTVCTLEHVKFGTVGRPLPGVEIRIAEEDGEILVRGPHVFREYWRNPEATAETLVDGWLHTGDLGSVDDEGYLSITGRKKDIIITAGGKNLTPSNIENDLKQSRFISQAVMHGDRRPFPVALITLDAEEILPWAKENGLPEDLGALSAADEVHALVQAELDRANADYAQVEQVKKFAILERDLTVEDGELTPTLKVKRNVINDRFADLFESLYAR